MLTIALLPRYSAKLIEQVQKVGKLKPRNILLGELRKVLLQYGDHLQLSYLSMLQIATKGS